MRRINVLWMGGLPLVVLFASLAVLSDAWATTPDQTTAYNVPECVTGTLKSAVPQKLFVGDEATITAVITGTCPVFDLPSDLVILVDKSNSMTKGQPGQGGTPGIGPGDPTSQPGPGIFPTSGIPGPGPTKDPGVIPTAIAPEGNEPEVMDGVDQLITPLPRPTDPPKPTQVNPGIAPPTATGIGSDLIRRGTIENPGTEDNIREMQQAVSEFLSELDPMVKSGQLRVGLVSFDDRAHTLQTLTDNITKVRSAVQRIRGGGNTRLDLGIQGAQRELVGATVRGRTDMDHRKLIVIFSDGVVDRRTVVRLHTRDGLDVLSVAVGRSGDGIAVLRKLATRSDYFFMSNQRKQLADTFKKVPPKQRPLKMLTMDVLEQLAPNMELVAGSANPPASALPDARTMTWHLEPPVLPMTLTYRVRPLEAGNIKLSAANKATFTDSEKRTRDIKFPEVVLEVKKPGSPDLAGANR